jgi:type I restriction enzyme R subunit
MRWSGGRDEADTCRDLIVPMLTGAGWEDELVREQYPLRAARILTSGVTSRRIGDGRADYVLEATPGLPVAVLEAKREYKLATGGLQQAIRYAQQLDIPIAYASNGHQIVERNLRKGTERFVDSVGTPAELWAEWTSFQGLNEETGELVLSWC